MRYFKDIKRAILLLSVQTDKLFEQNEQTLQQIKYHLDKAMEKLQCHTFPKPNVR